ncbi:MAG: acyltransferase [Sulfuricella sp.]|jgi:acetyltransferase-like isoleucine patch superfamily enzyme
MLRFLLKSYNKLYVLIYEPWLHLLGRAYLVAAGVYFGRGVKLFGLPIVSVHPKSKIVVGDNLTLRSISRGNAIGVNHPVILRTLAAGAVLQLGNRIGMSGGAICAQQSIVIGDDVLIGANVVIADNDFHPLSYESRKNGNDDIVAKSIVIERGVWIGADVYICKGVTIGEKSVIGAKSVVTKSIPSNCIAAGIPAKVVSENV